ncbi:hypothetical protein MCEGE14_01840 [Burkholderiaceae bacterium]
MIVLLWGSVSFLPMLWTSCAALLSQGVVWTSRQISGGPALTRDAGTASSIIVPVRMTS